jgi:hypothetical protein
MGVAIDFVLKRSARNAGGIRGVIVSDWAGATIGPNPKTAEENP